MIDIGLDFGSTYSVASFYNREKKSVESVTLTENDGASVPSVVAVNRIGNGVSIGRAAKGKGKNATVFRAFKMLLGVEDEKKLAEWNYSAENSPEKIAGIFLGEFIAKVLSRVGESEIGSLRIGVPEIWGNELLERTVDGQTLSAFSSNVDSKVKLLNICRSLPLLQGVDVKTVSEPVAASSYYAYRSMMADAKPFRGHILLIDYGGGTLDLTLTEVSARDTHGGEAAMEIRAPFKTGAGENYEPGRIGKAGLVYMESLTRRAIAEAEAAEEGDIPNDADFQTAVNAVENLLLSQKAEIDNTFASVGVNPQDLDEESMMAMDSEPNVGEFWYRGQQITLSYLQLLQVYEEVIAPVLGQTLKEYAAYREEKRIDDSESNAEHFKIVLVGGFGNFYLVKHQINEFFDFRANDRRREYIFSEEADGELAVSRGTALLAAGVVELRQTPPCSIGVAVKIGSKYLKSFAMLYNADEINGEPFRYDTPYLQRDMTPAHRPQLITSHGGIKEFLICFKEDLRATQVLTPTKELGDRIRELSRSTEGFEALFSVDDQGIFTLYLQNIDDQDQEVGEMRSIRLDRIERMFDTQALRRAFPDESI